MEYVQKSLKHSEQPNGSSEMSVLRRVLLLENDPKVASILALDMFLVGVDTVR